MAGMTTFHCTGPLLCRLAEACSWGGHINYTTCPGNEAIDRIDNTVPYSTGGCKVSNATIRLTTSGKGLYCKPWSAASASTKLHRRILVKPELLYKKHSDGRVRVRYVRQGCAEHYAKEGRKGGMKDCRRSVRTPTYIKHETVDVGAGNRLGFTRSVVIDRNYLLVSYDYCRPGNSSFPAPWCRKARRARN